MIINTSDSRYANDIINLQWLQHFITCIKAFSLSEYKLFLYDSHSSHCIAKFEQLAFQNCIVLCKFLLHLTYFLQPLDVGCFKIYKHQQKIAIYQVLRYLKDNYNIAYFLRDFPKFRREAIKEKIISNAFCKSDMFLLNVKIVLMYMR